MADTTALKNRIKAAIKANSNQEITGPVLQQALLDMVDELDLNPELENEASARQSGDSTLQQNLNAETQQRQSGDSTLQQNLNAEAQRAQDAEQTLQQNIIQAQATFRNTAQNFFELVERQELGLETWSNNAGITRVGTNIMGKTESNIIKVDFHINNTNTNTLGISFWPSHMTINEGDIVNFAVCFYTDDEAERSYELGIYTRAFDGTFTLLTPKILNVKKGFNYFFLSIRSNFTQTIGAPGPSYQVFFKDNSLDGKTWYAKAYWYIGTPNQKLLIPFDSTLVKDSKNLVRSGNIKRYVDDADSVLQQNIALLKTNLVNNAQNFFELVERRELGLITWSNNADITTRAETNIMGKTESNIRKVDFHINNTNANTLGISFRPSHMTINEGDIVNFAICFYSDEDVERNYNLSVNTTGFSGTFTLLTPKVLNVKKGFNYFFLSIRSNFTQTIGAPNPVYQVYFKDNGLDGKTWYAKAYWYIGTPNQKLLIPFDNTLVEDSDNLVKSGVIKRYVDIADNALKKYVDIADNALKNCIFYHFNLDTIRIQGSGGRGYTLAKYDKYYSVTYNHVDESGYSIGNILIGYAKDFRNGERLYLRYDIRVFGEARIIKTIPGQWGPPNLIGDGIVSVVSIEGGYYIDYRQSVLDAIENLSDDTPIVLAFGVNDGNSSQYSSLDGKTGIFRVSNTIPEKFNYEESEKILRVDKVENDVKEVENDVKEVENDVKEVEQRVEDIEEQIGISKKVVCWGDSLTAGAGSDHETNAATVKAVIEAKGYTLSSQKYNYVTMLQALLGADYNVINSGVGGENINAISARQGGNLAILSDIVELPSDTSAVDISRPISSFDRSSMVNVLLQGDRYVNPCYVQGIPCTLSVTYDAGYTNMQYRLKRNEAGDRAVTLPQYTPIVMRGSKLNPTTEIAVLWCWQNGGYSTNEELVEKLKNMISHLHTTKYLLIGLHSRSLNSGNTQEALLEKTFGDKFFNWRQYASTNALYDFNITPTEDDITAMESGSMPPSLLVDAVHLNSAGYMILGWKLFERMSNLGYIE